MKQIILFTVISLLTIGCQTRETESMIEEANTTAQSKQTMTTLQKSALNATAQSSISDPVPTDLPGGPYVIGGTNIPGVPLRLRPKDYLLTIRPNVKLTSVTITIMNQTGPPLRVDKFTNVDYLEYKINKGMQMYVYIEYPGKFKVTHYMYDLYQDKKVISFYKEKEGNNYLRIDKLYSSVQTETE